MIATGKGTRVRLLKSETGRVSIGAIGTVIEINKPCTDDPTPIRLWVLYDNFKSPFKEGYYASLPEDVEPIYDGDTKSSWEECSWKPILEGVNNE